MGELIYQAPKPIPPHKHDNPELRWENTHVYTPGSIWKCDCGQQFKVAARDGYNVWTKHDPNAPTPRRKILRSRDRRADEIFRGM